MSYFVYGFQMEPVLLSVMYSFSSSTVRDRMTQNSRSAVRFEIVTDQPKELSQAIIQKLHHSTTLIPAKGMYKGKDTNVLICVVNKSQVAEVTSLVKSFPNSFVTVSHVNAVVGNFKRLDSHGKLQTSMLDEIET